ncbi:Rv3654c family TadE-like protein [Haloglycomyces albus]|uniref:Rv3654c family TadE-like protein n=1 Tax=Haloglycomyces albus TaxID=526067 RepID=UPI000A015C5F|nr:Rv3654c family TadE-like protein [Haloglycomyces albus]
MFDTPPRPERERGSATIIVVAVIAAIVVIALAWGAVAQARAARHHAKMAADTASLAAAQHLSLGEASACRAATRMAERNSARMRDCSVDGEAVSVTVSYRDTVVSGGVISAEAHARAGPVTTGV